MEMLIYLPNILWPWILKAVFKTTVSFQEMFLQLLAIIFIASLTYFAALWSGLMDHEIWNGYVMDKEKVKVSCEHSYSCNCRTECSGSGEHKTCSTVCDTCYEHSYDWDWRVYSTIGTFEISRIDKRGSQTPPRWAQVVKGDPVSASRMYTNYILGAPDSLFNFKNIESDPYALQVPEYPRKVYDYYRVDRVISQGIPVNAKEWSWQLQDMLSKVGNRKEVNVVILLTSISDPAFAESVRNGWKGGKKNDVVVVVGSDNNLSINWASVISWTDSEIFKVKLRDAILDLKTLEPESFIGTVKGLVMSDFSRKSMADFEYLKKEMKPSKAALLFSFIMCLAANIGLTIFFHRNDVNLFETIRR